MKMSHCTPSICTIFICQLHLSEAGEGKEMASDQLYQVFLIILTREIGLKINYLASRTPEKTLKRAICQSSKDKSLIIWPQDKEIKH